MRLPRSQGGESADDPTAESTSGRIASPATARRARLPSGGGVAASGAMWPGGGQLVLFWPTGTIRDQTAEPRGALTGV